jgi:uncharacterized protein with GYD domain
MAMNWRGMSTYIIRYRYPRELWQGLVMNPVDLREAMRATASSVGVDIKEVWYALGPWDVYWLLEAPDNLTTLAFRIFDLSHGYVPEMEVIPLITIEETIEAAKKVQNSIANRGPNPEVGVYAAGWQSGGRSNWPTVDGADSS